ncbi:MAG: hypothetical protein AAGA56_12855, partial [Myxococcota bacterium]
MIRAWARAVTRPAVARATIAIGLVLTALAAWSARRVNQDDDLLAFLPAENAAVAEFYEIDRSFGSLNVGLVGIESADPFSAAFLQRLDRLTTLLNEESSIAFALSLANVEDFRASSEGGIETFYLVQ